MLTGVKRFRFLLTHPVWDVTLSHFHREKRQKISTHTSRVGCDQVFFEGFPVPDHFYSHIPCGMWQILWRTMSNLYRFLLTHPVWDVTMRQGQYMTLVKISTHTSRVGCDWLNPMAKYVDYISTHTSRVGCDKKASRFRLAFIYFYSHIPCGMWRRTTYTMAAYLRFLLTHPVWDVTTSAYP